MSNKKPLQEGDVQSYAEGKVIKELYPNKEIHLDHIPSKQAIRLAYADAIGEDLKDISEPTITAIDKETTTLATYRKNHSSSSTSKINSKLAHLDKDVLALAAVRDLEQFKSYELQRGVMTESQIEASIEKVHARNYDLGIYTKNEVAIAQKYVTQLKELKLHKHTDLPSYQDIVEKYRAELDKAPKLNVEVFEKQLSKSPKLNRLSKSPVIILGALGTLVFSEKADASSTSPLRSDANLPKDSFDGPTIGVKIDAGITAAQAVQAGLEFNSGASKSPKILLNPDAYKEGFQEMTDAWKRTPAKEAAKVSAMDSAKFLGKSTLKKIPLLGFVAGIFFGIKRAIDGDWNGAALEIASGASSIIPGPGTLTSAGIDAVLLERDTHFFSDTAKKFIDREPKTEILDNHNTKPSYNMDLNLDNKSFFENKNQNETKKEPNLEATIKGITEAQKIEIAKGVEKCIPSEDSNTHQKVMAADVGITTSKLSDLKIVYSTDSAKQAQIEKTEKCIIDNIHQSLSFINQQQGEDNLDLDRGMD